LKKRILFLAPYPLDVAPSQRFRFELFLSDFSHDWEFQSFYTRRTWRVLYLRGFFAQKVLGISIGYLRRALIVFRQHQFDWIYLHRELTPFGPPLLGKMLNGKKLIYDFDDAIWMDDGHDKGRFWKWLKHRQKVAIICKHSFKVTVGNSFLKDYASRFSKNVEILPTLIDTARHKPGLIKKRSNLVVGWTGSHTTLFYLNSILPILKKLQKEFDFQFLVIANIEPDFDLKNWQFVKWSKEHEVEQLEAIDIGVMPLKNHEWELGKCGFKLIQYGAVAIPSVASPVGVNPEVIIDSDSGFLANTHKEWYEKLKLLISSEALRKEMGENARRHIVDKYAKSEWVGFFDALFS